MTEWRSVLGYEGLYKISDEGEVFSLGREIIQADGHKRRFPAKLMRVHSNGSAGHLKVWLTSLDGGRSHRYVHDLMLESFVGPRPLGMEGLHDDDDNGHNVLSNLRWGTRSENLQDSVRNGRHYWASLTHCRICGHELVHDGRQRTCLGCRRRRQREYRARKKERAA